MAENSDVALSAGTEAVPAHTIERRWLVLVAWIATLLLSKLPLVIARDVLGSDIPWIVLLWIGTAVLLFAATFIWSALKPLRGYFAVIGVIYLVTSLLDPLVSQGAIWQNLFQGTSAIVTLFGERVLIAIEAIIVLAAVLLMGVKRKEAFLTTGDLRAPAGGIRLPGWEKPVSWLAFGPLMALLLGGLFFAFLASQGPEGVSNFAVALPWLPLILLCAALNAFGEEAMYRAAPLAMLLPAVGPKQALWMTAVWFGLGHFYGAIPSGPIGFVQASLLGLLLGKAMLDTRGMGWSWTIHLVLDMTIYIFLAAMA